MHRSHTFLNFKISFSFQNTCRLYSRYTDALSLEQLWIQRQKKPRSRKYFGIPILNFCLKFKLHFKKYFLNRYFLCLSFFLQCPSQERKLKDFKVALDTKKWFITETLTKPISAVICICPFLQYFSWLAKWEVIWLH